MTFSQPPPPPVSETEQNADIDRTGDSVFACTTDVVRSVIDLNRETNFADSRTLVILITVSIMFALRCHCYNTSSILTSLVMFLRYLGSRKGSEVVVIRSR